jgi:hypothetical protein
MELRDQLLRDGTPLEDHRLYFDLWVKREDLSAREPGPAFSKTRGVYAHIAALPPEVDTIGVLDTYHSQAGHAVAHACRILGKEVVNFYPEYKHEPGHRAPQERARALGASLLGIPAGRSAVIYHQAKKILEHRWGRRASYMMPNALKLPEMVSETAREVQTLPKDFHPDAVLIPISSGTIAAGVIRGFIDRRVALVNALGHDDPGLPHFYLHMGYDRSPAEVLRYVASHVGEGFDPSRVQLISEGYGYKDQARPGVTPPWPCSPYYDLKALRWWVRSRCSGTHVNLLWNIG